MDNHMDNNPNGNRPDNNKGPGRQDPNKNHQSILAFLVCLLVTLVCFAMFTNMLKDNSSEITYDKFIEMVDDGDVKEVTLQSNTLTITPKHQSSGFSEEVYYANQMESVDKLTERLEGTGIKFEYKKPDAAGEIISMLVSVLLPTILLFVLLTVFMRRMNKGGGMMGVGKSRAKAYIQKDTGITFRDVAGQDEAKESLQEVVDTPRQDVPLIAVLRSPLVGMSADRLAEIRAVQREGDYYEALQQDEGEDAQAFLSLLHELRQVARELSADKLLWYIYDRCRVQAIFGAMEDGTARQARLRALNDYIRRLVQGGRTSLFDCVRQVRQLLESGDAPAITAAGAAGGVRLMSVHKSKGLEFPVVFLADLNRSFNRQDLDRPVLVHPQLGVGAERVEEERRLRYDTVSKTALALTLEREAKAEELRILYVAMTRAQEKLIMVCSRKNPDKHLKELCALAELPAPPEAVAAVNCPGDWPLLALLSTYQAGVFHDYTGVRPAVLCDGPEGLTMQLHRIGGEEDGGSAMPAEEPEAQAPDPQPDEAALAFRYSHSAATVTPSKVTATQLKGRAIDQEVAEGTLPARRTAAPEKPRFLQEKRGLTGAERGTAMHLAMQFLPLDTPAVPEAVTAIAERLTARRLLTPEQAAALDIPALARFLASPLAERIRTAPQVWREYRFALLTDAGIYDVAAAGEEILLQGVADCVFETTAGLTVVDFKTDRVTAAEASQRAEAYRPQLDAYAGALSRILEKPVTERVLYFFACGEEISL